MSFLKKKLDRERGGAAAAGGAGGKEGAFPFCYVNSVFAPGLDEGVGGLWRVSYLSMPFLLYCGLLGVWGNSKADMGKKRGRRVGLGRE